MSTLELSNSSLSSRLFSAEHLNTSLSYERHMLAQTVTSLRHKVSTLQQQLEQFGSPTSLESEFDTLLQAYLICKRSSLEYLESL